jgi:hypothetical protein
MAGQFVKMLERIMLDVAAADNCTREMSQHRSFEQDHRQHFVYTVRMQ